MVLLSAPMACIIFMPKPLVCFSNVAISGSSLSVEARCFSLRCFWRCALSFSAAFCFSLRVAHEHFLPPAAKWSYISLHQHRP